MCLHEACWYIVSQLRWIIRGPSSSCTESSRVGDRYGTCDDLDYDDDQSSSLGLESEQSELPSQL